MISSINRLESFDKWYKEIRVHDIKGLDPDSVVLRDQGPELMVEEERMSIESGDAPQAE